MQGVLNFNWQTRNKQEESNKKQKRIKEDPEKNKNQIRIKQ